MVVFLRVSIFLECTCTRQESLSRFGQLVRHKTCESTSYESKTQNAGFGTAHGFPDSGTLCPHSVLFWKRHQAHSSLAGHGLVSGVADLCGVWFCGTGRFRHGCRSLLEVVSGEWMAKLPREEISLAPALRRCLEDSQNHNQLLHL